MTAGIKACTRCGAEKPLEEFVKTARGDDQGAWWEDQR